MAGNKTLITGFPLLCWAGFGQDAAAYICGDRSPLPALRLPWAMASYGCVVHGLGREVMSAALVVTA